jgi:transposase
VLSLHNKQKIVIAAFIEGKSKRQIAREEGLDIKTVRRYIKNHEEDLDKIRTTNDKGEIRILADSIVQPPKYDTSNRSPIKLTQEICNRIKELLDVNRQRRSQGMYKQQMRNIDIHEILLSEGYDIGYTTVCNKIRDLLSSGREAFIKAEYEKGDVCEFDWGDVKLIVEGKKRILQMAVFTSAAGNYRYALLMPKQDTACFLESHSKFFSHISSVYKTMTYDNMKTAVRTFVGLNEKEPTEALLKLSVYYGFKFRFCNIRAGNEKPHVERSVDYVRHKAFAVKTEFDSLEQANTYLLEVCSRLNNVSQKLKDNKTASQILEEERPYLLPAMPAYDAAKVVEPRVDKYSTIMIGSCHYSVPDNNVGKRVTAKIYSDIIQCFSNGQLIAEHPRLYGFNQWTMKIEHYHRTLKRKPGALRNSTVLLQSDPRLQKIYKNHFIRKEKDFIELLQLIPQKSIDQVESAIEDLERLNPTDISFDKIKFMVERVKTVTSYIAKVSVPMDGKIPLEGHEIEAAAINQLKAFKEFIPSSINEFGKEGKVI